MLINEKEIFDIVVGNNIELPDVADDPRFPPLLGDERVKRNLLFIKIGEHISHKNDTFLKVEKYRETHKWVKILKDDVKFITVSYRLDEIYYNHGGYSRVICEISSNQYLMELLDLFLKVASIETIDLHYTNIWGDAEIPCWVKKDTGFLNLNI